MKRSIKVLFVCLLLAITISCSISLQYYFPTSDFSTVANAVSELNQYSIYITKGESYQLKVKGAKSRVKWKTDDASIATVNSKGKVTAKKKGTALITATTSNNIHFCYVHVETPKLSKTSIMLVKGTDYTLKVKGTNQKIKWTTTNKSVAKVSKYGTVYAKKAGTATITATIGKKAYTCDVKVEAPVISKKDLILEPGVKFKLNLSGTIRKVKWYSSNKTVATISQNGEILAKEKGFSTITAKVANSSFECKLTVEKPTISDTNLVLMKEGSKWLTVSGTYQDKTWTSSNETVATVDEYGDVDAVDVGTATITCNLGYKILTCFVTVENPVLSQSELTINEGETALLALNGTKQKVEWSSSNTSVATVSVNGMVTAVGEGYASIYAKIGTNRFTCDVTVKEAPVDLSQIQANYYDTGKGIVGVFKNSYKEAVSIEMTVLYYNQVGNLIDQKSSDAFAIPTGKEGAIKVSQPSDGNTWEYLDYSNYEVLLKAEKASRSNEELGNDYIKAEPTDTGNKIIVKATNSSDKNYSSIQIAILFFDASGKCIDYDYSYADCKAPGSVAYINFDYPYDRTNDSSITPASYKIYVNHAYKYSWE